MRRPLRFPLAAAALPLVVGLWLLAGAPPASAHALLRSSDPPAGADLERAPLQVLLTFTEQPDPGLSVVHVLDSSGRPVEGGRARPVPGHPLELAVPLGPLGKGAYTVTWRTVSRTDGHVTAGSFAFGIGVAAPTSANAGTVSATPPPDWTAIAGRFLFDAGTIVLLGAAAAGLLVFRPTGQAGAWSPQRLLLVGAVAAAVVGLLVQVAAERSRVGVPLGRLLVSPTGRALVGQAAALLLVAAAVALLLRFRGRPGRARTTSLALLGAGAAAALLLHADGGHASSKPLDLLVQWVHLLAVGVWIGGLVWLLLGLRGTETPASAAARFSRLATVAILVVAASGLSRAVAETGSWSGLLHTSFGHTLMVKAGLFAALAALGATNRFLLVPRLVAAEPLRPGPAARLAGVAGLASRASVPATTARGKLGGTLHQDLAASQAGERAGDAGAAGSGAGRLLRRTVAGELAVAVPLLVAAVLLSELPPASYVTATATKAPAQVSVTGNDYATSVRLTLTVTPGTAGMNVYQARVADYDSGTPLAASRVSLRFTLPSRPDVGESSLDLRRQAGAAGAWSGQGGQLSIAGSWSVTALVQLGGKALTVPLTVPVRQAPAPPQPSVTVLTQPGQPTIYQFSLPGGASMQAYLDPGRAGPNNDLHLTWFTASGGELPISGATVTATSPAGVTQTPRLLRFGAGHLAATGLTLTPGTWRFQVDATAKGGGSLTSSFQEVIQ
jgi:copper transport protein